MADVITSNTQLSSTKMAAIAAAAQKSLAFAAKLPPLFTDLSFLVGKGMKSLEIPKLTEFTVTDRASGAAADAVDLTASGDLMLLNKVPHINFIIDPQDEVQSRLDVQMEFASRAAAAQGRFVDAKLVAEIAAAGNPVGAAGDITKTWVLDAREYLEGNNADMGGLALLVGYDQHRVLLDIQDFVRYDSTGVAAAPIVTGMIGRIYGVPVIMSNAFGAQKYAMVEKSGLAYAFQRQPQVGVQAEVKYGPTAQRWAIEAQFGVKSMQIDVGTAALGKSALIAIDAN